MQRTMKRIGALVLALAMLAAFMPALGLENAHAEEAESINVLVTINNKGVLASDKNGDPVMDTKVTASDIDADGQITVDEVLKAAHEAYHEDEGDAYAVTEGAYGPAVSKLWGVETTNTLFFVNGTGLATGVSVATMEDGDSLYASVNQDDAYYSDVYCAFDRVEINTTKGEDVELTLTSKSSMAAVPEKLADVQIGAWVAGEFKAIEGAKTDEDGKVTLSFDDLGEYIITAAGTVKGKAYDYSDYPDVKEVDADCPLMAPYCVVKVAADPIDVKVTVNNKGVLASDINGNPVMDAEVTASDIDADGQITVDEVLKAAHEQYHEDEGDAYAVIEGVYGPAVSKLWGVETANTLFFVNGEAISANVAVATMEDGDSLYASINKDDSYYSDVYCAFDRAEVETTVNEDVELTLTSKSSMAAVPEKLADVQIGAWVAGEFKAIEGAKTDEDGKVTLSFEEPGEYIITATGTVEGKAYDYSDYPDVKEVDADCPLMAPYCVVRVGAEPVGLFLAVNNKGEYAKDKDGSPMMIEILVAEDLNFDGKVTVEEALIAAHDDYFEGGAPAGFKVEDPYGSGYEMVTRLWGVDTTNTLFFIDGEAITAGVTEAAVKEMGLLYASINKDDKYYSDFYTELESSAVVYRNEKCKVTLNGYMGMGMDPEKKPLEGVQIGTLDEDGEFTPIEGAVTDARGRAEVSFPEEGYYRLAAQGTVKAEVTDWSTMETVENDCPIMATNFLLRVSKNEEAEEINPVREAINWLPDPEDLTLEDKADVEAAVAMYEELDYIQQTYVFTSQANKLKVAEVTIAKLQAEADLETAKEEAAAAKKAEEDANKEAAAAKKAAEDANKEAAASEKAAEDAKKDAAAAEKAAEDANKEAAAAKADADAAKAAVEKAEADLKAANDEIAVLKKQVKKVKAKGQKKKASVSWKKLGSGYKYEVYTATKPNGKFKKAATTGKAKAAVKKLKSKKTYYVKVRGFKTVNGKKVYTQFSDTVSVKIK